MKPYVRTLRRHQQVWATVEENIEQNEIVINFQGDLVRVSNMTGKDFRPGSRVLLVVEALQPLRFRLLLTFARSHQQVDITI